MGAATKAGMTLGVGGEGVKERLGLIVKTSLIVGALLAVKIVIFRNDVEIITTLSLVTSLMGGVVFTLAILLSGTLTDFKESERLLGEFVSHVKRLYADVELVARNQESLQEMRASLRAYVADVADNLRRGEHWNSTAANAHLAVFDKAIVVAATSGAASSQVRTVQVWTSNVVRVVDRLEAIIQTTFLRAGYYLAGTAVAAALLALLFTDMGSFNQSLALFSFASFLLVGLFLLIQDIDNPFSGHARIDMAQLGSLEAWLDAASGETLKPALKPASAGTHRGIDPAGRPA